MSLVIHAHFPLKQSNNEISALVRIAIDGHRQATNARQPMKYRWNFNQWVGIDL